MQVKGKEAMTPAAGIKISVRYKAKKQIPWKVIIASGLRGVVTSPVLEILNSQLNKAMRDFT